MQDIIDRYKRADGKMGDSFARYEKILQSFPNETGKCLQIGYRGKPYGSNWDVLDKYDTSSYITHKEDLMATSISDETYDLIACSAVLEHVEYPDVAIAEMRRMLKVGGRIFVAVPFNQPYHPSPNDYYRWTPTGIKVSMGDFTQIDSGYFRIKGSYLYNGVFFYGTK